MKKLLQNQKVKTGWKVVRPWAMALALFLILRYTGVLAGVSYFTNKALLETGGMNASTDPLPSEETFDYNFKLISLNGDTIDFTQFKGQTIFLNLWATWCGPCRAEMPSIQELYNTIDHSKIAFVMLSLDAPSHNNKVVAYVKDKSFTFPVYRPHGALADVLNVPSIPTTFVINKDGKIVSKKVGTANYKTEKFKKFLEGL